ncbi:hypothetical protein H5410_045854, partial [Solanum commersonii]
MDSKKHSMDVDRASTHSTRVSAFDEARRPKLGMNLEVRHIFQHLESSGAAKALTAYLITSVPQYLVVGGLSFSEGTPQVGAVLAPMEWIGHNLTLFLSDQELSHGLIGGHALRLTLMVVRGFAISIAVITFHFESSVQTSHGGQSGPLGVRSHVTPIGSLQKVALDNDFLNAQVQLANYSSKFYRGRQ